MQVAFRPIAGARVRIVGVVLGVVRLPEVVAVASHRHAPPLILALMPIPPRHGDPPLLPSPWRQHRRRGDQFLRSRSRRISGAALTQRADATETGLAVTPLDSPTAE